MPIRLTEQLIQDYVPTQIGHEDYPELIAEGQAVDTVASAGVMIAYNWDPSHRRYARLEKFVTTFFSNFDTLLEEPYHPKWQDVNLAAKIPGWKRTLPAEAWLAEHKPPVEEDTAALREEFEVFIRSTDLGQSLNAAFVDSLFEQFKTWKEQQNAQ